ncbi:MAG: AAA family ATPase [Candidatus Micrarchaeia archaeon]
MPSFSEILSKPTVFSDRNVLSPHYIPDTLPFRDKEIEKIMVGLSPALKGERPRNMFIYGKTGTGKTCSVKHVLGKMGEYKEEGKPSPHGSKVDAKAGQTAQAPYVSSYVNCKMFNSRYRVIQKITKDILPSLDSMGFGLAMLYEKMMAEVETSGRRLIVILDEVDTVKDLDDLLYTLTRANDELKQGSISIIGISNKLSFKEKLGQRSRSSLCENEMIFASYTPPQMQAIISQRAKMGFRPHVVDDSAINLAAAITGQDVGDARYALKLLQKAGEIADEKGISKITDKEVEEARRSVESDVAFEAISTLPDHQQLVLLAIANLSIDKGKNTRLTEGAGEEDDSFLISGEVYEEYSKVARKFRKPRRSARWYREYLNDLEMLGLITTIESGAGQRGRTRLIRIGYLATDVKKIVEKNFSIIESADEEKS